MEHYKVVDLFAGAGGLSLGFSQTGQFDIVAAAENNENARKTYRRNHPTTQLYADVRDIDYSELIRSFGNIDFVIGGPPCQGFSNANRQHSTIISMNNRLVKEYVRAVSELRPRAFVMENVAMLRSNVHRFMVEEDDLTNPTVMDLVLTEDGIELLPAGNPLTDGVAFAQEYNNIEKYKWDNKFYKAINVLYRFRINQAKFDKAVEKYKKYLLPRLRELVSKHANDQDVVYEMDYKMAMSILNYIDNTDNDFKDTIAALEDALQVQRMLGKMQELHDNDIHVYGYRQVNGAIIADVKSYAVFDYIKGVLGSEKYGYSIHSMVLNALHYGAPQRRERFIIVGILGDLAYEKPRQEFFDGSYRTVRDAISDISNEDVSTDIASEPIKLKEVENLSALARQLRGTELYNHVATATRETAQARFNALKAGQNFHDLDDELKTSYSNAKRTQNTIYMRLKYDEPCGTVVNVRKSMWIHPELNRAISIREAARLQTFPDTFIFEGTKDSQYQQVGNAVPPMLANAIARSLLATFEKL